MKKNLIKYILIAAIAGFQSCADKSNTIQGEWIKGTEEERLEIIEKQFRGLDMTMIEVGYRYQELFWAGQDENWEYAKYQVEKINTAMEKGLERRPKRAASAQDFLNYALPEIEKVVTSKDTSLFNKNFIMLTSHCNSCHAMERVPYFTVNIPLERQSPIRK